MAGVVVELFSMRLWDLSGLAGTQKTTLVLHRGLDVRYFTEGRLYLLSHSHAVPSGAEYRLRALASAPSNDLPSRDFKNVATPMAEAVLSSASPAAPTLLTTTLLNNFGEALFIDLVITQATSAGTLNATLSAFLALKRRRWS